MWRQIRLVSSPGAVHNNKHLFVLAIRSGHHWEVLLAVECVAAMRVSDAAETVTASGSLNLRVPTIT